MPKNVLIILPNTIFEESINDIDIFSIDEINIIYDKYYFNENQHKQKLALWLASLEEYKSFLTNKIHNKIKIKSVYEYKGEKTLFVNNYNYYIYNPLDKHIKEKYGKLKNITFIKNHSIILSEDEIEEAYYHLIGNKKILRDKINIRHTDFYKYMRLKLNILVDKNSNPEGGKWSYDTLNRQKFSKDYKEKEIYINPSIIAINSIYKVYDEFPKAYGECNILYYQTSFKSAKKYLNDFIKYKLESFGKYQDAISEKVLIGEHANISAIMNIGLITPEYVIKTVERYYYSLDSSSKKKYINSVEGFIRQIIGWREYMRFVYIKFHNEVVNASYFTKIKDSSLEKIHKSWYNGSTGIHIFDNIIHKINETGYAHHIERLMVFNNVFIMYGFSREEIHNWFMRMFVDSYEWVMVANVCMNTNSLNNEVKYMSRVYIAGDNYIKKMSDYKDKDSMEVMKDLFKSFTKKNMNLLKSDYNLAGYIARYVKN
jgi:deoxyribodipyrimidine photolyase-related protein